MEIKESDFVLVSQILSEFANWDTTARLNHSLYAWCDYSDSNFDPHETMLGKVSNTLSGIVSAFGYMRLSILQVKQGTDVEKLESEGFREYDYYRYQYIVFSHSIATLQDLLFKLTSILYDLEIPKRMIGWKPLEKELNNRGLYSIKNILEQFYGEFSLHLTKRNKFSHEGLLSYKSLDNFYSTYIWTASHKDSKIIKKSYPQFTEGHNENIKLLQETKTKFIDELNGLYNDASQYVNELFNLYTHQLLSKMDEVFLRNHRGDLKQLGCFTINEYLASISL